MNISSLDKNFKIETTIEKEDIKFYKIDEYPFKVYGVFKENGKYRRMPEAVAKSVYSFLFPTNPRSLEVVSLDYTTTIPLEVFPSLLATLPHSLKT